MIKSLFYIVPAAVAVSAMVAHRDTSSMPMDSSNGMSGSSSMGAPMNVENEAMGNAMNAMDMSMDTAMPSIRDNVQITDTVIFNYALTLEHLESAFYQEGLSKYDNNTFTSAGLNRGLYEQIAGHEATHVAFISSVLGDQATQACNYSFPYTDVMSFAALSRVLEGVGDSAYLGGAALIQNKTLLTAAASILSVEARHAAWISSSEQDQVPWNGPLDVPLTMDQVYSLAAPFIVSCPSSNPPLPVQAFPALNVTNSNYEAGGQLSLGFNGSSNSSLFVTFFSGLNQYTAPYNNGSVQVPSELAQMGVVYAVLMNGNGSASDNTTVAGPTILNFPTNVTVDIERGSNGSLISSSNSAISTSGNISGSFFVIFATILLSSIVL